MLEMFLFHFELCLPLFLLVLIGWGLVKIRLFDKSTTSVLSSFTFRFLMPVLLFQLMSGLSEMPPVDWRVLIAFFGSCIVVYFLGRLLGRAFNLDNTGKTIFGIAAIFGNNVQLGVPIVQVSLGEAAMPTISILIVFSVLLLWSVAIASVELGKESTRIRDWHKVVRPMIRVFKNPVIIGIIAGSLYSFSGLQMPQFADKTIGYIASATSPIALIVVGMGLAQHSFSASLPKGLGISVLKIIIQPIIVYVFARLIGLGDIETQACVLTATLPVAINIFIMASEFKSQEGAASNAIFVSTFLSALVIPFALTLLGVTV